MSLSMELGMPAKRGKRTLRRKRSAISYNNTLQNTRDPSEQSVYAEFGRRLQARMIELGWNQSELARRASACLPKAAPGQKQGKEFIRDRVSHYVRGVRMPRPEGLAALAKALGVQPADLVPAGGVPYAGKAPAAFEMKTESPGRVMLRVNRAMSTRTATKISALIAEEDKRG
jgi:transcriptional regulator with XRE-family HTH domain